MLAQPADDVADALSRLGTVAFEWKLDGARVQVHKVDREVRVFTRNLNEITESVPEIVTAVRELPARELILDGEAIALAAGGAPQPFQVTMRRFGRRLDVESLRAELPLSPFFFDVLRRDGEALADAPARERFAVLEGSVPPGLVVPRLITSDLAPAQAFYADALARGHEGVMAKALDAPYEAGGRGGAWLKVKRAHTLDLVVLAAEWGNGRRRGWLSNLHLGARDPASGGFVMLGKTFKGMTDELLAWQTRELLALHRPCPARTGGRDRVQRPAGEPALPGRTRVALRPREGLPTRQAQRRRRHDRHGARAVRRPATLKVDSLRTPRHPGFQVVHGPKYLYAHLKLKVKSCTT
jgi:DNA ligase-1